ncbi:MAG: hypothetical protein HMLIMOIP_001305 [Candidatus Nitrosomirales archaeon]
MKTSTEYIDICDLEIENRRIVANLRFSEGLRKYFFTTELKVEYDTKITCDRSISVLPALSLVAPIAWARGTDIVVDRVDEAYLNSLQNVRRILEGWFPQFVSKSQIKPKSIVKNELHNHQGALLFSGGLDSITSYLRNKAEHLTLITLLMSEDRYRPFYEKLKNTFQGFAKDQGNDIHFIQSNIRGGTNNVVNNMLLASEFGLPTWWRSVSLGLVTLGLCAPLTASAGIAFVRMASTYRDNHGIPEADYYLSKTKISWADINAIDDSSDLTRQQKIRYFFKGHKDLYKYLLVCNNLSGHTIPIAKPYPENCGYCEKCLRTITGLMLEGIDPNECNFTVEPDILSHIKHAFTSGSLNLPRNNKIFWQDIQENVVDSTINFNGATGQKYPAEEFFTWFRNFDIESYRPKTYRLLTSELHFAIKHKGVHHALKRTMGYVIRKGKKRMRNRDSETPELVSPI